MTLTAFEHVIRVAIEIPQATGREAANFAGGKLTRMGGDTAASAEAPS